MRVLFLDIDGVLNSTRTRPADPQSLVDWLEPACVTALDAIVAATGAAVVVTSSWRIGRTRDELAAALAARGFRGRVAGVTPDLRAARLGRDDEIEAWLRAEGAGVEAYVIVDDALSLGRLEPRHYRTSPTRGLRADDVEAVATLLRDGS
ncbi:MAG TPA: HAD domain-containing protein [Polyangiaceae bacterium]|nr:HAD domain-containing protein [Polyangiaceae bacterium]